jgi:hypothetical protein
MRTQSLPPHITTAEQPPLYFLGLPTILRATAPSTDGAFGLVEQVMPPGFESPSQGRASNARLRRTTTCSWRGSPSTWQTRRGSISAGATQEVQNFGE